MVTLNQPQKNSKLVKKKHLRMTQKRNLFQHWMNLTRILKPRISKEFLNSGSPLLEITWRLA